MEHIEELLNDPGNHAVLKELAAREEAEIHELAEITGMKQERLEDKTEVLEQEDLVTTERTQVPTVLKIHGENREKLQKLQEDLSDFHREKTGRLKESIDEEEQAIEEAVAELNQRKEETDTVTREKKFERQKQILEDALHQIQEAESSEELLEAHSVSHRALRLTGFRKDDFHGFNPWRKLKASKKIEEVLSREPEEEETRSFFGNRWVKKSRLE